MSVVDPAFTSIFFLSSKFSVLCRNISLLHIVLSFGKKETDSIPSTSGWILVSL